MSFKLDPGTGKFRDVTAVILAGGQSTRFGRNKALLQLSGRSFIQRVADTLDSLFLQVLISSNLPQNFTVNRLPTVLDLFDEAGPLAGVHAALAWADCPHIFIVPCDMPLISKDCIKFLISRARSNEITLANDGRHSFPVMGVYPQTAGEEIGAFLRSGRRKIYDFLAHSPVAHRFISMPQFAAQLRNFNTPEDCRNIIDAWMDPASLPTQPEAGL